MSLAGFAFQACLIDRSSISPFRTNNLQAPLPLAKSIVISPRKVTRSLASLQYSRPLTLV
jgi:hypothetical protein